MKHGSISYDTLVFYPYGIRKKTQNKKRKTYNVKRKNQP